MDLKNAFGISIRLNSKMTFYVASMRNITRLDALSIPKKKYYNKINITVHLFILYFKLYISW